MLTMLAKEREPCQHRVESKSTTLRQHHADTEEEPCLTPTPTTGPCATSPTTGESPTTPSAPTEPADEANSPNPTPCSAAHPPGGRQPSSTSNDPARAPAPICERTPPVSDWEQQSPKGAPMSDPAAGHTYRAHFRIPRIMWAVFGRVCERRGLTRTERLLAVIREDIATHGDAKDLADLEAAERELTERRSRKGGRPPKKKPR